MRKLIITTIILLSATMAISQGVAINETGASPNPSAMLDVSSNSKGMLIPRMTYFERMLISMPAHGLVIYQTSHPHGFYYNHGTPESPEWRPLGQWHFSSLQNTVYTSDHTVAGNQLSVFRSTATTDVIENVLDLYRGTTGSPQSNMGTGLQFSNMVSNNAYFQSGRIASILENPIVGQASAGLLFQVRGVSDPNLENAMYIHSNRNIGIGTLEPTQKLDVNGQLRIRGGNPGTGKVLTSNANGEASWETIPGSSNWTVNGDDIYRNTGKVGIGTSLPEALLDVAGGNAIIHGVIVGRGGGGLEQNTVFGNQALRYNTDGDRNTAIGYWSMFGNNTGGGDGEDNTAVGWSTLGNFAFGSRNTALGSAALTNNNNGHNNVAVGFQALVTHNTGNSNVAVGTRAMYNNSGKSNLVAVGDSALFNNSINATSPIQGSRNTAIGSKALFANTAGYQNTALGFQSLMSNTTGTNNTATGDLALNQNTTGSGNTAFGNSSLNFNTTGVGNTAIGAWSLRFNTTGSHNLAIGYNALYWNRANYRSTAIGYEAMSNTDSRATNGRPTYNTALGYYALRGQDFESMEGRWNTAVGDEALTNNKNGNHNTAVGASALASNGLAGTQTWHSSSNTAIGSHALNSNTSGYYNTATGFEALFSNTTGFGNTANGYHAAKFNETGNFNAAFGFTALNQNTSGSNNTAIGRQAMNSNTSGFSNVAIGASALLQNTVIGNLVAIGDSALYNNGLNVSTGLHATRNTAIGSKALYANTNGYWNTATGFSALTNNSTGYHNTAIGSNSLGINTTGIQNVAVGSTALSRSNGNNNAALGYMALSNNISGHKNVAVGSQAMGGLFQPETTHSNIAIGYRAGYEMLGSGNIVIGDETGKVLFGSDNVWIGNGIGPSGSYVDNTIVLGTNTNTPTLSNRVFVGNASMQWIGGQTGWFHYSDARAKRNIQKDVPGLDFIMKLQPVSYNWSVDAMNQLLGVENPYTGQGYKDIEQQRISGFLAQEVDEAAHASGYDFSGVNKSGGVYSLSYGEFVVPLVKAVQELNERNDQLNELVEILMARIQALENILKD